MPFFADLHVHSHYSIATGRDAGLEGYYTWGLYKGINLIGTGDCLHPGWLKELETKLKPLDNGFFALKTPPALVFKLPDRGEILFCPTTEVSSIFKAGTKTKKIHTLLVFSSLKGAAAAARKLESYGKLASDGRPIVKIGPREVLEIALDSDPKVICIPAHIWTPWFSLLGEKSGFDSPEECFQDLSSEIAALETGLSSDPLMNRAVPSLNRYSLVSFSDAHSPSKLGRESTLFSCGLSYQEIRKALFSGIGLESTVEFFPEEGKYHLDGHRNCGFFLDPLESPEASSICPGCGKSFTPGVLNRVRQLALKGEGEKTDPPSYRSATSLTNILGEITGRGINTKGVAAHYRRLLEQFGNEYRILFDLAPEEAERALPRLGEALTNLRLGRVKKQGGYDGKFGRISVLS